MQSHAPYTHTPKKSICLLCSELFCEFWQRRPLNKLLAQYKYCLFKKGFQCLQSISEEGESWYLTQSGAPLKTSLNKVLSTTLAAADLPVLPPCRLPAMRNLHMSSCHPSVTIFF